MTETRQLPDEATESLAQPDGPVWAGVLSAAIGCLVLGLLADASEASPSVSKALNFYGPTGDLSGKTTVAIVIWLATWAGLHFLWKNRTIRSRGIVVAISAILILLAFIAVFPPFFELIAAH